MQLNTAKRASFDEGSLDQYLREISQYPLITRELLKRGYSKTDIEKILGGNFLRVLKANMH